MSGFYDKHQQLCGKDKHMQDIDLIICGGKALLMDDHNTCLEKAAIAIHASSILNVGKTEDILPKYKAKKTINAEGSLILPGFVNYAHARRDDLFPRDSGRSGTDGLAQ